MKKSIFTAYSFGVAAENLESGSQTLEVYPIEALPTAEGEVTTGKVSMEDKGIDGNGDEYEIKIDMGMTIPCEWFGGGNQITPPNIRRGERVVIYKQGDSQKYFWKSAGLDQDLRRLETIVWVFSGNPDNADQDGPSPENSYFLEISTHKGLITFSTSQINSEKAAFTFQIDTAEGTITFHDEKGNSSFFDSVNTILKIINVDKTFFEMNKKNISMFAEEIIDVKCETLNVLAKELIDVKTKVTNLESTESINFNTTDFMMAASASISLETTDTTLSSSGSITFETANYNITAVETNIESPVYNLTGVVNITGPVTASGPIVGAALAVGGGGGGMDEGGALTAATVEAAGPSKMPMLEVDAVMAGAVMIGGVPVKPGPWKT